MSRLTPAEKTAYRDRIARAQTVPDIMAVINEAAAAARPAPLAVTPTVRKPAGPAPNKVPAPTSVAVPQPPAVVTAKEDGSDIVALARTVGLAGVSLQLVSEKPSHEAKPTSEDDIVALVRSAGLAGFKRQDEESSR